MQVGTGPLIIKPVFAAQDMLNDFILHFHFGRLQPVVRLIPDDLVLHSKSDLVNRILPHFNVSEVIAYQLLALWFYYKRAGPDLLKSSYKNQSENRPSG